MTLKQKFIEAFKSGKRFDIKNAEIITDKFAIDFCIWLANEQINLDTDYKKEHFEILLKKYKKTL